jgi:ribA/ribD-fused uncharacterized protein
MGNAQIDLRSYHPNEVVAFRKTNEDFGGLSNMAPGFPLFIGSVQIRTSEALYQACRFPHLPDVQRMIIDEPSPMTAKMQSKPYREETRPDWDNVRIPIMRWCLRIKLVQNWQRFSDLLLQTGERPIVEDSRKDDYWGAKLADDGQLNGRNVLGRMLMELRYQIQAKPEDLREVLPLRIDDFLLLGRPIPKVTKKRSGAPEHIDAFAPTDDVEDREPTFSGI